MKKCLALVLMLLVSDVRSVELWNAPSLHQKFVGREKILDAIQNRLAEPGVSLIALVGIGGTGKTHIAKKWAQLSASSYDIVWWFDLSKNMEGQLKAFAHQWQYKFFPGVAMGPISEEGVILYVKNLLDTSSKRWLLILDNAPDLESIQPFLPTIQKDAHHVLVTTRDANAWDNKIVVPGFSPEEATFFLKKKGEDNQDEGTLLKIAQSLNFHPLSLSLTSQYMREQNMTPLTYLKDHKEGFMAKILRKLKNLFIKEIPGTFPQEALSTIKESIKTVRSKDAKAVELLYYLSLISHRQISEHVLDHISKTVLKVSEEETKKMIKNLDHQSLLESNRMNNENYYALHDLVKEALDETNSWDTKRKQIGNILKSLHSLFDKNWTALVKNLKSSNDLYDHLVALDREITKEDLFSENVIELKVALLENHIYNTRQHKEIERIAAELEEILKKRPKNASLSKAVARFYIDRIYVRSIYTSPKELEDAGEKVEAALQFFQETGDNLEYLRGSANKAQYLIFQGLFHKALEALDDAKEFFANASDPSYKLLSLYVKTWALMEIGDFKKGTAVCYEMTPLLEKEDNVAIKLYVQNMMASIYFDSEEYEKSYFYAQKSLKEAQDYYQSTDNEICAESLLITARYCLMKKDFEKAEKHVMRVIEIYEGYFGGEGKHQDQANALLTLGNIKEESGSFAQSLSIYQEALKILDRFFTENPSESKLYGKLLEHLAILGAKMKDENYTRQSIGKLVHIYGIDNPYLKSVISFLDKENLPIP